MSDRQSSNTAIGVAALRAYHQLFDSGTRILDDPIAVRLLGEAWVEQMRVDGGRIDTPLARGLRAHVVLRSRFAEDRLRAAVDRGVRQYVLLGAGVDTFAYRQPEWASALRIVEVDQPASQRTKRGLLQRAGVAMPENLTYADVDFEHETLADGLARHGVRGDVPTFFSWLGVTMYLTRPAIDAVLRTVSTFPSGSEIVLTFAQPQEPDASGPRELAERAAAAGEPWLSYFTPGAIDAALRGAGFTRVAFLSIEDAARYFVDSSLPAPRRVSIAAATV